MTLPTLAGVVTVAVGAVAADITSRVVASTHVTDGNLTAFVGLTGLVVSGFLLLARLSQQVVDDADESPGAAEAHEQDEAVDADGSVEADSAAAIEADSADEAVSAKETVDAHPSVADERSVGPGDGRATDAAVPGSEAETERDSETVTGESTPAEADHGSAPADADHESAAAGADREVRPAGTAESEEWDGRPLPGTSADRADPAEMSAGVLLLNVALTQGLFGALLAGGAVYFGVPAAALGMAGDALSTGLPAVGVGVAFGLVLWTGNELASGLAAEVGADYDEGLRELLAPEGRRAWILLLGATLPVIAVVEEFIFRAAAVGAASAAFPTSAWALALVSSVAFALGHGAQGRVGILVTGALGFALAAGFVLTNSLLVVVIAHYLVNALEFLVHEGLGLPDPVWG